MTIAYLIVMYDTHSDPEYQFRWNKDEAILIAENAVAEAAMHYRLSPEEIDRWCGNNGQWGRWFSASSPCGSFSVKVREILVPPFDSMKP